MYTVTHASKVTNYLSRLPLGSQVCFHGGIWWLAVGGYPSVPYNQVALQISSN